MRARLGASQRRCCSVVNVEPVTILRWMRAWSGPFPPDWRRSSLTSQRRFPRLAGRHLGR